MPAETCVEMREPEVYGLAMDIAQEPVHQEKYDYAAEAATA